jgi:hypothetical protein
MPVVFLVGNLQAVIERIEQLMGFIGGDHQRRRKEQRGLFAAGSDDGTRLQCTQRHPGSDGILKGIGAPRPPIRSMQLDGPMQSLPRHASYTWMPPGDR